MRLKLLQIEKILELLKGNNTRTVNEGQQKEKKIKMGFENSYRLM